MLRPSPRCVPTIFGLGFATLILAISSLLPAAAQTNPPAAPPTRKAPPPPPPAPVDQQQFISYWTTETGWQTQLELRNNQAKQPLTVMPRPPRNGRLRNAALAPRNSTAGCPNA